MNSIFISFSDVAFFGAMAHSLPHGEEMRIMILVALSALAGCATVTSVVSTGPGTYLVASQGVIGNGSGATQKVAAIQRAGAYCKARGEQLKVLKTEQSEPMFGRAPSGQVEFSCEKI